MKDGSKYRRRHKASGLEADLNSKSSIAYDSAALLSELNWHPSQSLS